MKNTLHIHATERANLLVKSVKEKLAEWSGDNEKKDSHEATYVDLAHWLTLPLHRHVELTELTKDAPLLFEELLSLTKNMIQPFDESLIYIFSFFTTIDRTGNLYNVSHLDYSVEGMLFSHHVEVLQTLLFVDDMSQKKPWFTPYTYTDIEADLKGFAENKQQLKKIEQLGLLLKFLLNVWEINLFRTTNSMDQQSFERDKIRVKTFYRLFKLRNDKSAANNFREHFELFLFKDHKGNTIHSKYRDKGSQPFETIVLLAKIVSDISNRLTMHIGYLGNIFESNDTEQKIKFLEFMLYQKDRTWKPEYFDQLKVNFKNVEDLDAFIWTVFLTESVQRLFKVDEEQLGINLKDVANEPKFADIINSLTVKNDSLYEISMDDFPEIPRKKRFPPLLFSDVLERIVMKSNQSGVELSAIFLNNPTLYTPFLKDDKGFYLPCFVALTHNLHYIMKTRILNDNGMLLSDKVNKASFLEEKTAELFRRYLSEAQVYECILYPNEVDELKSDENDVLVIYDSYMFIIESKAHYLDDLTRTNNRLRTLIQETIKKSTNQGVRFKNYLKPHVGSIAVLRQRIGEHTREIDIDLRNIKHIQLMSITYDSWGTVATQVKGLFDSGYISNTNEMGICMTISDLKFVLSSLSNPIERLYYLVARFRFEQHNKFFADEADLFHSCLFERFKRKKKETDLYLYGQSVSLNKKLHTHLIETNEYRVFQLWETPLFQRISELLETKARAQQDNRKQHGEDWVELALMWYDMLPNTDRLTENSIINGIGQIKQTWYNRKRTSTFLQHMNYGNNTIEPHAMPLIYVYTEPKSIMNNVLKNRDNIRQHINANRIEVRKRMKGDKAKRSVLIGICVSNTFDKEQIAFVHFYDEVKQIDYTMFIDEPLSINREL
ncbi:TPA: hypothetical protein QCX17_002240 [Bacillus cereus]|nr:hypothetical protein [Bacillus cereus]